MKHLLFISLLLLTLSSCSSTKKEIALEKAKTPEVQDRDDLHSRARKIVLSSKALSTDQKRKFLKISSEARTEIDQLNSEIRKVKILMFKSLADDDYSEHKLVALKRDLKSLEDKKFNVVVNALDSVKSILGVNFKEVFKERDFRTGRYIDII